MLTPLDIHQKEFRNAFRGYNTQEVDEFLDQVAADYEALYKSNIELKEEIERLKEKLNEYQKMNEAVQQTLLMAQQAADEARASAEERAKLTLERAKMKAKEILDEAQERVRSRERRIEELKALEDSFRARLRAVIESHLELLRESREAGLEAIAQAGASSDPDDDVE